MEEMRWSVNWKRRGRRPLCVVLFFKSPARSAVFIFPPAHATGPGRLSLRHSSLLSSLPSSLCPQALMALCHVETKWSSADPIMATSVACPTNYDVRLVVHAASPTSFTAAPSRYCPSFFPSFVFVCFWGELIVSFFNDLRLAAWKYWDADYKETPSVWSACCSGESNDQFNQMFGVGNKSKLIMEGRKCKAARGTEFRLAPLKRGWENQTMSPNRRWRNCKLKQTAVFLSSGMTISCPAVRNLPMLSTSLGQC